MRTAALTVVACGIAFSVDYLIAMAGLRFTDVPRNFPPFTFLPILSGCVGGILMASITFTLLKRLSHQPERVFLFVAVTMLALSFALPLRLSFTRSPRFAGVTPSAQAVLVLMHTAVATVAIVTLLAKPR